MAKLRSAFEAEILKQKNELAVRFIDILGLSALDERHMHDVLDQVERSLADDSKSGASNGQLKSTRAKSQDDSTLAERVREASANQSSPEVFWRRFQDGHVPSWNHYTHLRAGFFVLSEGPTGSRSVMDAADIFLRHLARLRESDPQRFRNTAHRYVWLALLCVSYSLRC